MKNKKKGSQQKKPFAASHLKNKYGETNPFELRINKVKHNVIGQKVKNNVGNPGASRNRINKIRLEQLKKTSELRSKSNIFVDKRIGEYDKSVSKEDRINARIVHARKRKCKKDIFNLNDDEPLTHLGEDILNLEEFDKPGSDSDEEDNVRLDADFVDKAHFGGFLTKKVQDDAPKTHKEIIGDIILESKQKKEEKKAVKRENEELGERLDRQWKEMQPLFAQMKKKEENLGPNKESYDMIFRELKFEPRGTAATALKSEEQIKREEEQKRIQMEKERRLRMMNPKHLQKKQTIETLSVDRLNYYDGLEPVSNQEKPEEDAKNDASDESGSSDAESENADEDLDDTVGEINEQPESEHPVPQTLHEFSLLIDSSSAADVSSKLKSIIDSLHPGLKSGNKAKLENFYSLIAKYLCTYHKEFLNLDLLDNFVVLLYDFAQLSSLKAGACFKDILKEKFTHFQKKHVNTSPSYDILLTLKLCSILFSTSDYHHPIATPAMLLMSHILTKPYKITSFNIIARLFLSNLFFEYVAYSKRLATEPILFLQDIFYMASSELLPTNLTPRHHVLLKKKRFLHVDSVIQNDPSPISFKLFNPTNIMENTNELKVSIIFCATKLLQKFTTLYESEAMFIEIFSPFLSFIDHLPVTMYPAVLAEAVSDLKSIVQNHSTTLMYLTYPYKKPPMLKMLEPKFEMNYSAEKKVTLKNKLKVEKQIQQKIKKEEKSLIREVRREAQFIAGEQLKNQRLADEERMMKVKRLRQELSMQEGEFKKLCKKK